MLHFQIYFPNIKYDIKYTMRKLNLCYRPIPSRRYVVSIIDNNYCYCTYNFTLLLVGSFPTMRDVGIFFSPPSLTYV